MFTQPRFTQKPAKSNGFSFNWGAFFLTWIWAIGNRSFNRVMLMLLALCFVPYLGVLAALALMLYCGRTGGQSAWNNRKWDDIGHFERVQKRWAVLGASQFILGILLLLILPIFVGR